MKHKINDREYEEGFLHFFFDENKKLMVVPPSKYELLKFTLPDLCFAIKYPIKDLENKTFDIDLNELSNFLTGSTDFAYHEGI